VTHQPTPTQPPSATHSTPAQKSAQLLREKFDEETASQASRMDALARQLITLELAIPSLYATILKLLQDGKASASLDLPLQLAFLCWFLALVCTLAALFPRNYKVDPQIIRYAEPVADKAAPLSIEAYFKNSARYKLRWLSVAILFFFAGICTALYSLS